jgi:chromosomal replication initiation ATPase DnaA
MPFTLADLRSRLLAFPAAAIHAPDDYLLRRYLFKCFSDRQLRTSREVIEYLERRLERSFSACHAVVAAAEKRALETGKPVTLSLVKSLIG